MTVRDLSRLPDVLRRLYAIVAELEEMVPGRRFTLDGHLVGSIGEAVAEYVYDLELQPTGFRAHDATSGGIAVQIKLTQGKVVAISYHCEHLIVIRLDRRRGFEEIYNGPGAAVWAEIAENAIEGRQRLVGLNRLKSIAGRAGGKPIKRIREFPLLLTETQ